MADDYEPATIYVYNEKTGIIDYTVDDATTDQISNFQDKDVSFYVGRPGQNVLGTVIKKNETTGEPIGISPILYMNFISVSKDYIVANSADETTISGLKNGMIVNVDGDLIYTVDDETGTTLDLSANGYSYAPGKNHISVLLKGYGYYDSQINIRLIEGE